MGAQTASCPADEAAPFAAVCETKNVFVSDRVPYPVELERPRPPPKEKTAGVGMKALDLWDILHTLEWSLATPKDNVETIAQAYRGLQSWASLHKDDYDLQNLLAELEEEDRYPAWRRKALEEAYALFYEEAAKRRDDEVLRALPEPPTTEERGYRALADEVTSTGAFRRQNVRGTYDDRGWCIGRRYAYDIQKCAPLKPPPAADPLLTPKTPQRCGREIVSKGHEDRACNVGGPGIAMRAIQSLIGKDACCGRQLTNSAPQTGTKGEQPARAAPGGRASQASTATRTQARPSYDNVRAPSGPGAVKG